MMAVGRMVVEVEGARVVGAVDRLGDGTMVLKPVGLRDGLLDGFDVLVEGVLVSFEVGCFVGKLVGFLVPMAAVMRGCTNFLSLRARSQLSGVVPLETPPAGPPNPNMVGISVEVSPFDRDGTLVVGAPDGVAVGFELSDFEEGFLVDAFDEGLADGRTDGARVGSHLF